MSGVVCCCPAGPERRAPWRVVQRQSNHSAFSGYLRTPSAYSEVRCLAPLGGCGGRWRTRAGYVAELPDE